MNSPYMGKFKVTQIQHSSHDGFDLVGLDSKEIHATVSGVVHYAGWENPANTKQGFGQYVCIKSADGKYYYYGHLSQIKVHTGDKVKVTDVIGIEGYTGHTIPEGAGGSHCHYCCRPKFSVGNAYNISQLSGIPNALGTYDDGYRPGTAPKPAEKKSIKITVEIDDHQYSGLISEI